MDCFEFTLAATLCSLLSACATSNDYIGETYDIPDSKRCTLETKVKCLQKFEDFDFDFEYNVFQSGEGKFHIKGETTWTGSTVYEESKNINIKFFVFADNTVIDVVSTWGKGRNLSNPIKIDLEFDSLGFDFVMLASYRYRISE